MECGNRLRVGVRAKSAVACQGLRVGPSIGNGPNTVSGSTASNTELTELFGAHWVPGSELSEFLSAYYLCVNANSPSLSQNSPSLPQNSVSSLLRNSTLETVFHPFPILRFWSGSTSGILDPSAGLGLSVGCREPAGAIRECSSCILQSTSEPDLDSRRA